MYRSQRNELNSSTSQNEAS